MYLRGNWSVLQLLEQWDWNVLQLNFNISIQGGDTIPYQRLGAYWLVIFDRCNVWAYKSAMYALVEPIVMRMDIGSVRRKKKITQVYILDMKKEKESLLS